MSEIDCFCEQGGRHKPNMAWEWDTLMELATNHRKIKSANCLTLWLYYSQYLSNFYCNITFKSIKFQFSINFHSDIPLLSSLQLAMGVLGRVLGDWHLIHELMKQY